MRIGVDVVGTFTDLVVLDEESSILAFNPAVSLSDAMRGGLRWNEVPVYVGAQIGGAIAGVAAANTLFGAPCNF